MRGRGRGRARGTRGRRGTTMRGRPKKNVKVIESDEEEGQSDAMTEQHDENFQPVKIDLEADISQLEAPTFTTLNRGPPEPMLRLRWDHRVSLIGEKVLNPMIHCCEKCLKPILIYGRMIPCKHVFCVSCAREEDKACPRCKEPVSRVEQATLGSVFMCTHGGSRYGNTGCRRTYLSQRDLQAHINHRHSSMEGDGVPGPKMVASIVPAAPPPRKITQPSVQNDPRAEQNPMQYRSNQCRTNLITVPIQQDQPPSHPPPPPAVTHYHQSQPPVQPPSGVVPQTAPPAVPSGYPSSPYVTPPPPGPYSAPPAPPTYYSQAPPPPPPPQYPQHPYPDQTQYWSSHPPPPLHTFYR